MRMLKLLSMPDMLTLTNAIFGMLSIFCAINNRFKLAALLIIIAVLFDFFDGFIARALKKESTLGKDLDSLSDLVSFGIAPALITFLLIQSTSLLLFILTITCCILFVVAGIIRLARFNTINSTSTYEGMPITINGLIFPLLLLAGLKTILPYYLVISAILMISSFKLKKPFVNKKKKSR